MRFGLVWVVLGWDSGWGLRAWDFPTERVLGSPDPPLNSRAELRKIRVQGKTTTFGVLERASTRASSSGLWRLVFVRVKPKSKKK